MPNIFDPIDGEPLRDFLGQLQNANARSAQQRSQQATNSKLDQIAFLLAQQQAQLASLPPCPYCHGRLEGTPELCKHCRSNLSWVEGYPCKPGMEIELKKQIDEAQRLAEEQAEEEARIKAECDANEVEEMGNYWMRVVNFIVFTIIVIVVGIALTDLF
jgi:hypothetical protein